LGLKPHELSKTLIESMFLIVERYQDRVDRAALRPFVNWRRASNPVQPPSFSLVGAS
jgi:UDP-sulfoquinovose synthase